MKTNHPSPSSRIVRVLSSGALALGLATTALAQGTTAFTYQGHLQDGATALNGLYDFNFTVWNVASGPALVGPAVTPAAVPVSNGLFTVTLDFGSIVFEGSARWLQIAVKTNLAPSYTTLTPRQRLTPTPYALYAGTAGSAIPADNSVTSIKIVDGQVMTVDLANNAVTSAKILDGTILSPDLADGSVTTSKIADVNVTTAKLADGAVTSSKIADGAITALDIGAGQVVKSLNSLKDAVTLAAGANVTVTPSGQTLTLASPTDWHLTGNSGTTPGTHYLGTADNQPLELKVNGQRAMRWEPQTNAWPNVIGGSAGNQVASGVGGATVAGGHYNVIAAGSAMATIGGGQLNTVQGSFATVSGGDGNVISNTQAAAIGGGIQNKIGSGAEKATISGGYVNSIGSNSGFAAIGGGVGNHIAMDAARSTIGGGDYNAITANAHHATVTGGAYNTNSAAQSSIGGGAKNAISTNSPGAVIAGGLNNSIAHHADGTVIGGGASNSVGWVYGVVGGGWHNYVVNRYGVIGGGADNVANPDYGVVVGGLANYLGGSAANSFVGGGQNNYVGFQSPFGTISGGSNNTIQANAVRATIAGGSQNLVGSYSSGAVIGGGEGNTLQTYALRSVIGGGGSNLIEDNASEAVIGGGWYNRIRYNAGFSVLGGGSNNRIETNSSYSVLAGGLMNVTGNNSRYGVIGGGFGNLLGANTSYATVMGGDLNLASGTNSFAAGHRAKAQRTGSFVWADATDLDFDPYALAGLQGIANSFNVRASGGVYLATSVNAASGQITSGAYLASGGGAWVAYSDRNGKDNFKAVSQREVLEKVAALPLTTWNYKSQDGTIRHLGPMAQDFKAAFNLGESSTGINTVDADGVALAAIQGLNQIVHEKDAEIQALKARLDRLEQLIKTRNGGGQ